MNKLIVSIKKNSLGIIIMFVAALLTSLGQMFWKISGGSYNGWLLTGFGFYCLGAIMMIIAFRFGSLSVLHPIISVSYVFALVFGQVVLNEQVSTIQAAGVLIIIIGVILVGVGDE